MFSIASPKPMFMSPNLEEWRRRCRATTRKPAKTIFAVCATYTRASSESMNRITRILANIGMWVFGLGVVYFAVFIIWAVMMIDCLDSDRGQEFCLDSGLTKAVQVVYSPMVVAMQEMYK